MITLGLTTPSRLGGSVVRSVGAYDGSAYTQDSHARFMEAVNRGNVYSTGMQLTSISAATFTFADATSATLATAATATPIVGIWNPPLNQVECVILTATLAITITALQATGCGGFGWVVFPGQTAITVSSQAVPVNNKTLLAAGSNVRGLSGLALTGLIASNGALATGNFLRASSLNGGSNQTDAFLQTAVGTLPSAMSSIEPIDGSIIVPPGGILGLFCGGTPVAHSAGSGLTWEEVPLAS
jgi:hypothetical protein